MLATMSEDTREWIGVDLDGTLAHAKPKWECDECIGEPIPEMADRVRLWISQGERVKIMTARAGILLQRSPVSGKIGDQEFVDNQIRVIQDWTEDHFGVRLEVTATKDYLMKQLWDDRAIQVVTNTGTPAVEFWRDLFKYIYERLGGGLL
jgi:hypothetical protein